MCRHCNRANENNNVVALTLNIYANLLLNGPITNNGSLSSRSKTHSNYNYNWKLTDTSNVRAIKCGLLTCVGKHVILIYQKPTKAQLNRCGFI